MITRFIIYFRIILLYKCIAIILPMSNLPTKEKLIINNLNSNNVLHVDIYKCKSKIIPYVILKSISI